MPVITLTTDLGLSDYYVAVVKGEILKRVPGAVIIDITHNVPMFSITHAAFILRNSYSHFPPQTIHVAAVDTNFSPNLKHLVFDHQGYYFIGPDNGLFSLAFENQLPEKFYSVSGITNPSTLPASNLYVEIIQNLANGMNPENFAQREESIRIISSFRPIISGNYIKAFVVYIDHFDNVMINLTREEFENASKGRKFVVGFKRNTDIGNISRDYSEINDGDISCVVNSAGYIELFMKHGNMAGLLGLKENDNVVIEFK